MRTTLEIDDDVLQAAKELSAREKTTAGRLISEWARRGIRVRADRSSEPAVLNGFEVLPAEGRVVTSTKWETAGLTFALTFLDFKRSDPNE